MSGSVNWATDEGYGLGSQGNLEGIGHERGVSDYPR
jgi:hypothetical protein